MITGWQKSLKMENQTSSSLLDDLQYVGTKVEHQHHERTGTRRRKRRNQWEQEEKKATERKEPREIKGEVTRRDRGRAGSIVSIVVAERWDLRGAGGGQESQGCRGVCIFNVAYLARDEQLNNAQEGGKGNGGDRGGGGGRRRRRRG